MAQTVKNLPSLIPWLGRSTGEGNGYYPLQHSCLQNPQGQNILGGYIPWDHKNLDMTEWQPPPPTHRHTCAGLGTPGIQYDIMLTNYICNELSKYGHILRKRGLGLQHRFFGVKEGHNSTHNNQPEPGYRRGPDRLGDSAHIVLRWPGLNLLGPPGPQLLWGFILWALCNSMKEIVFSSRYFLRELSIHFSLSNIFSCSLSEYLCPRWPGFFITWKIPQTPNQKEPQVNHISI